MTTPGLKLSERGRVAFEFKPRVAQQFVYARTAEQGMGTEGRDSTPAPLTRAVTGVCLLCIGSIRAEPLCVQCNNQPYIRHDCGTAVLPRHLIAEDLSAEGVDFDEGL